MFIQTEVTPNPATLKFLPGRVVLDEGTAEFLSHEDAEVRSPLAARLMAVDGVTGVFFGYDFVTVSKDGPEWQHLKPAILAGLMEHFMSNAPVMAENGAAAESDSGEEFFEPESAGIVSTIKELLETRVRPAVAQDGGDIEFDSFDMDSGTLYLHMRGAYSGCPSSSATLRQGVESLMKHYVPEVKSIEQVL